jgi:hypothetical protein
MRQHWRRSDAVNAFPATAKSSPLLEREAQPRCASCLRERRFSHERADLDSLCGRPDGAFPDVMAVDCAGNLYLAGQADVEVFSPAGAPLGKIALSSNDEFATNLAFGGPDGKTLYVTANTFVSSSTLNVPGRPY